jgi:hypothetical protein
MTSAQFAQFIVEETEKWGKVVNFAGIKADRSWVAALLHLFWPRVRKGVKTASRAAK